MSSGISRRSPADLSSSEQEVVEGMAGQFGTVLRHYFARRVREREEVEDLVQEVFLRLLKRGKIEELADPRAYIFETAANTLADRARKRRSRYMEVHETFDPAVHPYEDFASDRVLIGEETLTHVSRALLELPERTRAIFILRRLEGMRYQEIARRLGLSLSLVEKQMAKAVAYLQRRLNEE
jgi:RNA polymerase sigma factor (sigma-70 family)